MLPSLQILLLSSLVLWASVECRSDEHGKNPQHDFGSISGRKINPVIPFWTMLGDAFANEDFVRLTPDRQSKTGGVWNSQKLIWSEWEVLVKFNVNGVGSQGADGFALWLAKEVNTLGKFYGFREKFHGIGVVIDTYDNDGTGMHPLVTVLQNDGKKTYDHHHEGGKHHASDMELGHCSTRVRNLNEHTMMKIRYKGHELTVETKLDGEENWKPCVSVTTTIEKNLFLGMTAATGHLADNHDVYGVTVRNLEPDAQYSDSEAKYSQFSKYSIAERLGKIQADIRKSAFSTTALNLPNQPKPKNTNPVASYGASNEATEVVAKLDDTVRSELGGLKRDIQNLLSAIEAKRGQDRSYNNQAIQHSNNNNMQAIQGVIDPLQRATRDLQTVEGDLKKGVSDITGETKKLSMLQNKVDRLIASLDSKERKQQKQQNLYYEEEPNTFSLFNIAFFIICLICLYLVITLYRINNKAAHHIKV